MSNKLTADAWAGEVAGLISLISVDTTVPEEWRNACRLALGDAPDSVILHGLTSVLGLANDSAK